jgi:2-polyprenyl-6-methoxyphenol hydroxylase-like FAD-dependent oxidoreductase
VADVGRILIVGGGIAGLTIATALHRLGYAPQLVERSAAWPTVGAGINLPANGVRVLRALGLGEAVERAAAVLRRWDIFDDSGKLICETDVEEFWRDVGPCLGVTRRRLQGVLQNGAATVSHRLGVSLTGLSQRNNHVRAGFSDGTCSEYDLVVGADGVHSTVRRLALDTSSPTYAGLMMWRSVISTCPPDLTDFMILRGEGLSVGLIPMGEGYSYCFASTGGSRFEDPLAGRPARFRQRFAAFRGPVPAYLAALEHDEQLHFGPIEWVDLDDWHRGRVVLIGDAAHASPPTMAEGGCMAMEDAFVLAEVLRAADNIEHALEAYVARRRPRVDWVQAQSRVAAREMVLSPNVRNAILRERGNQMFQERYRPLIAPP